MRILIVEDDFISRRVIQKILAPYGECDIAVNGKEALVALGLALQERNPYTLMTLDIMMPEMDGQQVLRAFRDKEDNLKLPFPSRLKVVMISALGDTENVMKAFSSLADAYLVKPISKEKLVEVLGQLGLKK